MKPGASPGVLIINTRVRRDGKEMMTDGGAVSSWKLLGCLLGQLSLLRLHAWEVKSERLCATMITFGMCAKLVPRGLNTTMAHGRENIDTGFARNADIFLVGH